jgi:hypothetical protein
MKSFTEYLNEHLHFNATDKDIIDYELDDKDGRYFNGFNRMYTKNRLNPLDASLPGVVCNMFQTIPVKLDDHGRFTRQDFQKIIDHIENHYKSLKIFTPAEKNDNWDSLERRNSMPWDSETFKFGYFKFDGRFECHTDHVHESDESNDTYYDPIGVLKNEVRVNRDIKFKYLFINPDDYRKEQIKWEKKHGNLNSFMSDPSLWTAFTYHLVVRVELHVINYDPKKIMGSPGAYGKPRFWVVINNYDKLGNPPAGQKKWVSPDYSLSQIGQIFSASFWNTALRSALPLFMSKLFQDLSKRHQLKKPLSLY